MISLLLIARLGLAAVFLVSGGSKFRDLAAFRQSLSDFGVPSFAVRLLGVLIPLLELGIAVGLVGGGTAWFAALTAIGLLFLFTIAMSVNLALGRTPDCNCFGRLSSQPISWRTIARNMLLAAPATVIVWQGQISAQGSLISWMTVLTLDQQLIVASSLVVLLFLALEAWLLFQIVGQQGRLLLRLDAIESKLSRNGSPSFWVPNQADLASEAGLPMGQLAPRFELQSLSGETITLDSLLARGKPTLLAFSDPGCRPCNALFPEIGRWQKDTFATITLAVISRGSVEANKLKAAEHNLTDVLLQVDHEVAEAYGTNSTPAMVLVRPDGTIGSAPALGQDAITRLMNHVSALPDTVPFRVIPDNGSYGNGHGQSDNSPPMLSGLRIGDDAPLLQLPNLDGTITSIESFRGTETLVLFWNPSCGYCNQMLNDLKAWEANPPGDAPKLFVVSTGPVEVNRAMGLRSPVVLASDYSAARSFGVRGTPSAILVDNDGKTASEVAVGASAIFKLAGARVATAEVVE